MGRNELVLAEVGGLPTAAGGHQQHRRIFGWDGTKRLARVPSLERHLLPSHRGSGGNQEEESGFQSLQKHGVSPSVCRRMKNRDPGAQTERPGRSEAGEGLAWRRDFTGWFVYLLSFQIVGL